MALQVGPLSPLVGEGQGEGVLTAVVDLEKANRIRKAALDPPGLDSLRRHLGV